MRKTTTIILLAVMFFTALLIAGCNRNGNDHNSTAETQSVGGDDGTVRYRVSEKKDFYIPLYDWYRRT